MKTHLLDLFRWLMLAALGLFPKRMTSYWNPSSLLSKCCMLSSNSLPLWENEPLHSYLFFLKPSFVLSYIYRFCSLHPVFTLCIPLLAFSFHFTLKNSTIHINLPLQIGYRMASFTQTNSLAISSFMLSASLLLGSTMFEFEKTSAVIAISSFYPLPVAFRKIVHLLSQSPFLPISAL